jgi:hypothetical protein
MLGHSAGTPKKTVASVNDAVKLQADVEFGDSSCCGTSWGSRLLLASYFHFLFAKAKGKTREYNQILIQVATGCNKDGIFLSATYYFSYRYRNTSI